MRTLQPPQGRLRRLRAFTLIELLVTVVIVGVLAAIAIPMFLNYQKTSHDKAGQADAHTVILALENCYAQNHTYPTAATFDSTTQLLSFTTTGTCDDVQLSQSTEIDVQFVTTNPQSYTIDAYNTEGNGTSTGGTHFCYDSSVGGSLAETDGVCTF